MPDTFAEQIAAVEDEIDTLNSKLEQAKLAVQEWTDASASLSRSAAEARAKNQ